MVGPHRFALQYLGGRSLSNPPRDLPRVTIFVKHFNCRGCRGVRLARSHLPQCESPFVNPLLGHPHCAEDDNQNL